MNNIICIDIGGTHTRVVLYDQNMNKIKFLKFATNPHDYVDTLNKICNFINKYPSVQALGISAPGPIDFNKGKFLKLPNLIGWENLEFVKYIKSKTHIQNIKMQNDANLMALAQHHYFQNNQKDITQLFTISTGIGAGLIINNKIYTGSNNQAQEVARLPLAWNKASGKNLSEGALEYYASGSGIEIQGKAKGFNSTQEIFQAYQNDKNAQKIIDEGIETLANLIATTCALINPSLIVFDGSVARYNKWYVNRAIEIAKTRMFESQWKKTRFEFSQLGDDAALIGAYNLIKE